MAGQGSLQGPEPLGAPAQRHLPRLSLVLGLCFPIPWPHRPVLSALEKYLHEKANYVPAGQKSGALPD